jgi:hypothetical protein
MELVGRRRASPGRLVEATVELDRFVDSNGFELLCRRMAA